MLPGQKLMEVLILINKIQTLNIPLQLLFVLPQVAKSCYCKFSHNAYVWGGGGGILNAVIELKSCVKQLIFSSSLTFLILNIKTNITNKRL